MSNDGKINLGIIRNEYSDLLKYNNLIPFETFFQIDYYTLHQQEREEGESLFYAQAWALIHFLMDKKPTELHQFIELILSGQSPKEAFIKAFNSNFAGLEKNLKDYLEQKSFQTRQETIDKSTDSKFQPFRARKASFI